MATAILKTMPTGIAGDVTRPHLSKVEPIAVGTPAPTAFGVPMKISAGKAIPFAGAEAASAFYGINTRSTPSVGGNINAGFSNGIPNANPVTGILRAGYISVLCKVGTPARGGAVYIRVVDASPKFIGDLEATADSTNSVIMPNASWATDGKDAGNNAEIFIR